MNNIGVIGSQESIFMIKDIDIKSKVILRFLAYDYPNEAPNIVKEYKGKVDAFIFLGPIPYYNCSEILRNEKLLYKVIEFDHYVLSNTLFNNIKSKDLTVSKFSLDTFNKNVVVDVLNDLKLDSEKVYIKNDINQSDIEELKEFHIKLWENREIDFVITGVSSILNELKKHKIPCYKVEFSRHTYLKAIEDLNLITKYKKIKLKTLVVGSIIVHFKKDISPEMYYTHEKNLLDIYKALLDICSKYDLSIYRLNNTFKIIGTKGSFSNVMKMEELILLINKFGIQTKIDLSIGFGSGETSLEADRNSLEALELFEMNSKKIFLVANNEKVEVVSSDRNQNYLYLFRDAEDKYSIKEKELFTNYLSYAEDSELSVKEYVKFAQVSYRTGTRFFNRLLEDSIIHKTGRIENQIGRPAKLYKIKGE